jgi:hypothetical protein
VFPDVRGFHIPPAPGDRPLKPGFLVARIIAAAWGAMIVAGLVIGAVGPDSWKDRIANDGPGCPLKATTGIDCPFCGMTRATLAMGGGDFDRALDLHPLAPLVVIGTVALMFLISIGRTDALLKGKRPVILLGVIGVVWILRFVL